PHAERLQHRPGQEEQRKGDRRPGPRQPLRELHEQAADSVDDRGEDELRESHAHRLRHSDRDRTSRYLAVSGGASSARATRRELSLIARDELVTLIVARETASTSTPTLNASRMLFPRNCAANSGRSMEKLPYGSWCSTTTTPVRMPLVSMPTRILIG